MDLLVVIILGIAKHLLFNLSLLLVLLFFLQIWFERKMPIKKSISILYVSGIIAILLCMLFSVSINPEVRVDLRFVPLVISSLYLGSSFLFAGVAIVIRAFFGIDSGFWVTVSINLSLGLLLLLARPSFKKLLSSKNRISVSIGFSILSSMIFFEALFLFDQPNYGLDMWVPYFIISALGTGIIAYALESMYSNMKLREQIWKTKRIEAVSQMGAAISHEIRNPLTAAKGFLQFLKEGNNLEQSQKEYISIAIKELDQAEEVIGNYLTFAKPAMERVEELNVHWILVQVLTELSPMININNIVIEKEFNSSGIIIGDKQMLHQCFSNLIKNCIESMPTGGDVYLISFDTKQATTICITASGFKMTEEQIQRQGEPFYAINEGKGTGLEMMVVHSILRALNGSIEIKSKPDEGTTFILQFPKKERTRQII